MPDLLVGHEQERRVAEAPRLAHDALEDRDGHRDAGLHVEDARARGAAGLDPKRHVGERTHRPDGVVMAEEQGAPRSAAGQQGASPRGGQGRVSACTPALAQAVATQRASRRHARGVVGGAFARDQGGQVVEHPRERLLEASQARVRA